MFESKYISKRDANAFLYIGIAPGAVNFAREHTQTHRFYR